MTRTVLSRLAAAAAVLALLVSAAHAIDDGASCEDLYRYRNQFYASHGYCFKTARAIRMFGNAGCQYDNIHDVPLSSGERADIADTVRAERRNGCRD